MENRHLIVISVDALVYEDIADTSQLPLFARLIREGELIKNVRTIFPSLTHPVHASIITGQPAGVTGITANTVFTPGAEEMPWYNKLPEIQCETIFDLTHRAGLKTAACHWPVTANAGEKIDYNIPELTSEDLAGAVLAGSDKINDKKNIPSTIVEHAAKAFINIGMSPGLTEILEIALKKYGSSLEHPVYDEVQIECACEIIRRFKPDVLFTHPGTVDSERHRTGLFSPEVVAAVKKSEEWIGSVIQAAKDAGIYENTDFIILSDHGHLPYSKIIRLNALFVSEGLIRLNDDGSIKDWDAYAQSCDLSAYIYLKRPEDADIRRCVEKLITKGHVREKLTTPGPMHGREEQTTFGTIIDNEEAEKLYGLKGDFSYVIEAAEGYCFSDEWRGEAIYEEKYQEAGKDIDFLSGISDRPSHSAHGHRPEKGPQPVFIGFGPDFEKGKVTDGGNILDFFQLFRDILKT